MDPECAYTEDMICPSEILEPDNLLGVLSECPWALLSSGYDSIGAWGGGRRDQAEGRGQMPAIRRAGILNICAFSPPFISQERHKK